MAITLEISQLCAPKSESTISPLNLTPADRPLVCCLVKTIIKQIPIEFSTIVIYHLFGKMAYQASSWHDFYFSHPDNEVSNNQMEQLITLFSAGATEADFISHIRENQGLAAIAVDHFNRVLLFHQVTVFGPNLQYPDQIILALSGSNESALAFRILPSSFSEVFEVTCPPWTELKGTKSGADVLSSQLHSGYLIRTRIR